VRLSSFGLTQHFVTLCGDFQHRADRLDEPARGDRRVRSFRHDRLGLLSDGTNRWLLAGLLRLPGLSLIWLPYSGFP